MEDELISRMRDRIRRAQRVIELAHDPEMIELLGQMIAEAEDDIRRIEATIRETTILIEQE